MADNVQNSAAPAYMGEFCHAIDGKNRITIPSEWRSGEEGELYLMPGATNACLSIIPRAVLDNIRAKASARPGPERILALRRIGSQSRQVAIDKHGRLSLPEEFCQQLKLSGNVTLVGVVESFEIWNTDEWKAAQAAQKTASDAILADLGL
jgi:MraZ protein